MVFILARYLYDIKIKYLYGYLRRFRGLVKELESKLYSSPASSHQDFLNLNTFLLLYAGISLLGVTINFFASRVRFRVRFEGYRYLLDFLEFDFPVTVIDLEVLQRKD